MAAAASEIIISDSFTIETKEEAPPAAAEEEQFQSIDIPQIEVVNNNNPDPSDTSSWSSSFQARSRSHSTTPRSRQTSPRTTSASPNFFFFFAAAAGSNNNTNHQQSRFSNTNKPPSRFQFLLGSFFSTFNRTKRQQHRGGGLKKRGAGVRRVVWYSRKRFRGVLCVSLLVGFFFLMNWWMLSQLQDDAAAAAGFTRKDGKFSNSVVKGEWSKFGKGKRSQRIIFSRMLALAAHALAEGEGKPEAKDLWEEPLISASAWTPCADQHNWEPNEGRNGYILVSANGGINQQRVAVCNVVTLARLLNSTLILPNFLFSSVWRDARDGEVTKSNSTIS